MRIFSTPHSLAHEHGPVALATGFFDGVHRGHLRVLDATIARARTLGGQAWALTFDPHPMAVLAPDRRPPLLTPTEFRLERLAAAGLDGCLLLRFTAELARLTPEQFVDRILCVDGWHPESVFAGDNWRFGAGGQGSALTLPALSHGRIDAVVVPPALDGGETISSTRIRTALQRGDVETAARLLGRPYRIRARVIHGRGVGHELGVATANLIPHAEVLPPYGVYALWAGVGNRIHRAVGSYGIRPTFPETEHFGAILEVHLLDFDGDLYGREMDVAFVARLRDEQRFPTREALCAQIHRDTALTCTLLGNPPPQLFPPPCPFVPTDTAP